MGCVKNWGWAEEDGCVVFRVNGLRDGVRCCGFVWFVRRAVAAAVVLSLLLFRLLQRFRRFRPRRFCRVQCFLCFALCGEDFF